MKIKVENLTKEFKDSLILNDINLEFQEGKVYGLVGPNGSGKSVLLKIICAFYMPTKGKVLIDGVNYNDGNNFPPNLRALIDKPSFIPDLSGFENLKLLAKIQNLINDDDIINTLKIVNLYEEKDKKFYKYSMGMKQKLGIASVLMEDPKIMILDEPFNGIDDKSKSKLFEYLAKIKKNKIIIISSHIVEEIQKVCDEVYYFENGTCVKKWVLWKKI